MAASENSPEGDTEHREADPFPDLTEEQAEAYKREQALRERDEFPFTSHAYVDVPAEVYELAEDKAEAFDAPEKVGEYLAAYLNHAYAFVVDGEVVGTVGGFDPEQAVTPDDDG